ncbi:MAG: ankyrin repeat domain-containing protein [Gammaproteobacteria bacterium]
MQKTINAVLFVFAVLLAGFSVSANARECDLCIAAATGDTEKITELIAAGAEVNITTHYGGMPLMYAARHGRAAAVDLLIQNGADRDAKDDRGLSPIMIAAIAGHADVLTVLMNHNAEPNVRDENDWTPLTYAARYGITVAVSALLAGSDSSSGIANFRGVDGWTPMMAAAVGGQQDIMLMILGAGGVSDLDAENNYRTTALMFAAYFGHLEVANVLLSRQVSLNRRARDGRTAVFYALARDVLFQSECPNQSPLTRRLLNNISPPPNRDITDKLGLTYDAYVRCDDVHGYYEQLPPSPSLQEIHFVLRQ